MGFPLKGLPQVLAFCYVLTYSCMYAGRFVLNVAATLVRGFFQPQDLKVSERP